MLIMGSASFSFAKSKKDKAKTELKAAKKQGKDKGDKKLKKSAKQAKLQQHVNSEAMSYALVSTINEFQFGADTIAKTLAEQHANDPEKLTAIAWAYSRFTRSAETLDKSYEYIDRALKVDPKYAPALVLSGDVHKIYHRYDSAAIFYKKAIEVAPDDPAGYLKMAEIEKEVNNSQTAANEYYALAKARGMSDNDWAQYLTGLFFMGEHERTCLEADTAILLYPEKKELNRFKLYSLDVLHRYDEALAYGDILNKAVKDGQLDSLNHYDAFYLGEANLRLGRDAEAMKYFGMLYDKAYTEAGYQTLQRMGAIRKIFVDSLKTEGRYDEAATLYNRFLDINPYRRYSDYFYLAAFYNDKARALKSDSLIAESDRDALVKSAYLQADSVYRTIPGKFSDYNKGSVAFNRGTALYNVSDYDAARTQFTACVQHLRGSSEEADIQRMAYSYYYMAWMSYYDGDYDGAYRNAKESLKYDPDNSSMMQFADVLGPKKKVKRK